MTSADKKITISVLGMGYVGCVSAACLARDGHTIIGVDISDVKLKAISSGKSPIHEPGLDKLIQDSVNQGRMSVTPNVEEAILKSDLSLICVGTPSHANGSLNLEYVARVCEQIGAALRKREPGHTVVIRSTMLPGTMNQLVKPTLAKSSGKTEGKDYFTAINPEFLREGSAISDYDQPPKIVIGTDSEIAASMLRLIYRKLEAPLVVTPPEVAEMVKYSDNVWHATKIAFANEIGEICRQAGVDSHAVIDIFLQDTRLNISPTYLRPGFAFGGSCLPKDLRALTYYARHHDLDAPLLQNVLTSNQARIENAAQRILATGKRRVGLYGLSFKRHTDDLRESPYVTLAERLIGKGIEIRIFDENIQMERLTGANKQYINAHIPHLVNLLVDGFGSFDTFAELVVIGHNSDEAKNWVARRNPDIKVIDLARLPGMRGTPNYEGVSW